jgi:peptidyl-prolyl cis-trans isomerase SurA
VLCWALLLPLVAVAAQLDRVVAVVNKDVIVQSELDREVQRIVTDLRRRGTATPPPSEFQRQVLEHLVVKRLQLQLADVAGINIGDDELNFTLQNIAGRNNMSLQQMHDAVVGDGSSFDDFRDEIRNEMRLTQLRQKEVISRISVSDAEIERFLAEGGDVAAARYRLSHILIALPADPTPQQVRATQAQAQGVRDELLAGADFASTAVAV